MKLIYLVIKDILILIKRETRVFIIMLLSLITAIYSTLFLYNLFLERKANMEENFSNYIAREYKVDFNTVGDVNKKYGFIESIKTSDSLPNIDNIHIMTSSNYLGNPITIIAFYSLKNTQTLFEGRAFSKSEVSKAEHVAIVSESLLDYRDLLTNLDVPFKLDNGKVFKTIGVTSYYGDICIPYTTYIKDKYDISTCQITFDKVLNNEEVKLILKMIEKDFPSAKIKFPPKIDKNTVNAFIAIIAIIALLQLFSLINVVSMFKFWATQNLFKFSVFNLCGSKKNQQYLLITLEVLFISIISFLTGLLLYFITVPKLKSVELYYHISIIEIASIFVIFIICMLLSINSTAKKISKVTPINKDL